MQVISMNQERFIATLAKEIDYLRIEDSHGAFNSTIQNIDNVVGFIKGKAVVITDLDEKQVEYYARQKKVK